YSMVTATTLDCNNKEEYNERLPQEGEKAVLDTDAAGKELDNTNSILYADDFSYAGYASDYLASRGNEPRYLVDYSGAFVVKDGKLEQLLPTSVGEWNHNDPNAVIGDFRWMNYKASIDVTVPGTGYAAIAIREQTGMGLEGSGYNLRITKDGMWTLKKRGSTLVSGVVKADSNGSYQLSLEGKGGIITAWVDGKQVAEYLDTNPEYFGRVRIASSWDKTTFDNLSVEKIAGYLPYATQMIDNASDEVTYQGGWNIIAGAGGSNNDWYRSTSTNTNTGDSLQFTLKGDGFALIGANNGSAKLNITVDGEQKALNAVTNSSSQHCATYMMTGLEDKQHQVVVTVVEGTLVLDAIYFLPYSKTNKDKLNALLENANALEKGDYTDATWSTFTTARSDAQAVLEKIDATQQEVDTSQVALALAMQGLLKGSSVVLAEEVQTAMYAGGAWNLPATLNCETADGNKVVKNVIWNTADLSPKAYDTITVFGTISGEKYVAKATIEVVPKDLIYFVDAGTGIGYYNNNTTAAQSKPYDLVHGLVTDLKNTSSDVAYSDANGWGYINDGTTNKVSATVDGGDRPNTYTSTDKYNVGLRDKTNRAQPMRYRFTLDAGKYELTVGCHEFYGSGRVRDMQPGVVWKDAKGNDKEVKGTVINLRSQNNTGTVSFSLDTTAVVEFQLSYVSGEASMYSWLGVAKTGEYDPNEIVTITAPDMCAVASGQAIELPQTVEVTTVEGVTKTVAVTWDTEGVDLVTPYKTVLIKGSVESSSLTTEVKVEVIPSTLVWFIDSGIDLETQTTTAPFQAVKNRIPSIKNDKADQAFAGGVTWGYNADAVKIKGQSDIDMSNKAESGLYGQGSGETSSPIIYTLPMEAGNYNINLGFHEWWGMTRTMKVSASWIDALGDAKEVVLADKVTLSPSHLEEQVSDAIALDAGTVVTIKIERAEGTEAPVVSWLAVDKVLPVDKSDLAKAVSGAAILVETNYTKESFANVSEALKEAYGVLADENATKEAVITALNALQNAVANLEIRIEAPKAQITTDPVDTSALANEKVVLVTLLAPAPSEAIYYTLDGSTSSITSNRYTAPFEVKTSNVKGETISVKAVSVYEDQISKSVEKTIVFLPRDNGGAGSVISIPLPTPSSDRTVYQEGDTITYAKDAFEKAAKEKQDLHVVVKDKSGKEVYSWKFEGKDLAAAKDEQKDVDLTLKIVPTKESDELKEVLSKEEGVVLNFGYDGMLPSQATVRVNVKDSLDASNVGKRVYVYHYNQETKKLENLPFSSTYKMDEEGYVSINLVHCSDYVILAKKPGRSMIATLGEQIQATNGKKTLSIGKSKQIEVTLPQTLEQVKYLKDATTSSALGGAKVRYHSLDKAIAIVDANGKIVAKKKGKTTILTKVTLYNKKVIVFKTTITVK
ncbi:MAG: hypothetical protein PWP24_1696, partial [Clostridiales bacterium]|nr:hypothetical protein [Clostridiales bacterium]